MVGHQKHQFLSVVGAVVTTLWIIAGTTTVHGFSTPGVSRVFVSTPTKANPRLVSDCMTPNPITLKTTDSIDEAIEVLLAAGFNGAPVVDPVTSNLVGVVSAFDFLQKAEAGAVLPFSSAASEEEQAKMVHVAQKIVATTVGDLMAPAALTISPDMTIREATDLMLRDRCHRLCVVDEDKRLVGVLSTSDIMKDVISALEALPSSDTTSTQKIPTELGTDGQTGTEALKP